MNAESSDDTLLRFEILQLLVREREYSTTLILMEAERYYRWCTQTENEVEQ